MKQKKIIALLTAITVLLAFSACSSSGPSSRSKKTVEDEVSSSETTGATDETEPQNDEEENDDDNSDTNPSTTVTETSEESAVMSSREFADYLLNNYEVTEVTPGEFYSDILNQSEVEKGTLCYASGSDAIDNFEKSYLIASRTGTLTNLTPEFWMITNLESMAQYSRYSMQSEDGTLKMMTESVTLYDYSDNNVAQKVFTNIMKSYEPYGLYVENLSEEEYGLENGRGHFIIGFGLEEYIHLLDLSEDIEIIPEDELDGGGTQGQLFNEYTKVVGIYLRGSQITIVSFTSTMDSESVIAELASKMDLEDPFKVKSSSDILELFIEK